MAAWRSEWVDAMAPPLARFPRAESDEDAARALPLRLGAMLLVLGAFVSITTAGRLAPEHLVGTAAMWSFLPALQALALRVALAAGRSRAPFRASLSRYYAGHGPWYALLLAVAGVCLFAPEVGAALRALLRTGALPVALLAALGRRDVAHVPRRAPEHAEREEPRRRGERAPHRNTPNSGSSAPAATYHPATLPPRTT